MLRFQVVFNSNFLGRDPCLGGNSVLVLPIMRIYQFEPHAPCRVTALSGAPEIVERLEEMGLSKGRTLCLIRRIPFGGPFIVQAGSSFIALRADEADCLEVELTAASAATTGTAAKV